MRDTAGLGATIIDSLDTLYIMGMEEEFNRARVRALGLGVAVKPLLCHSTTEIF